MSNDVSSESPFTPTLSPEYRGEGEMHSVRNRFLSIPHPACWYRRFVLDPWNDVDPDWIHPHLRETVRAMRDRLLIRPLQVGLLSHDPSWSSAVESGIQAEFPTSCVATHILADDSTVPEITLTPFKEPGASRCVGLGPLPAAAIDAAREILQAALDEPAPLPDPLGF